MDRDLIEESRKFSVSEALLDKAKLGLAGSLCHMPMGAEDLAWNVERLSRPQCRAIWELKKAGLINYHEIPDEPGIIHVWSLKRLAKWYDDRLSRKSSSKMPTLAATPKEKRDKWIYDECMKGTPYQTIAIHLKKKPKNWPRIESVNGIKMAAKRYAERHSLPEPPPRQSGRRPS